MVSLMANSNRLPKRNKKMGSVNRYGNMGIEYNWVKQYFELKDDFGDRHIHLALTWSKT